MKKILLFLLYLCFIHYTNGQVIGASPACLTSATTSSTSYITASGLIPSTGVLTVTTPIKFIVSLDGSSWSYDTVNIPYTAGTLAATPVNIIYAGPAGLGEMGLVSVSGGGASSLNIPVCANTPSCPCAIANVSNVPGSLFTSISPNPVHNTLTISSPDIITSIIITDLIGRNVSSQPINSDKTIFDVSELPPGVYLLRINGSEIKKFVKQ